MEVRIIDTRQVGLLGLVLRRVLEEKSKTPRGEKAIRRMRGTHEIACEGQRVWVSFSQDAIEIGPVPDEGPRPKVRISAKAQECLELIAGGGHRAAAIIAVLEGRLKLRGRPWAGLSLLALLGSRSKSISQEPTTAEADS